MPYAGAGPYYPRAAGEGYGEPVPNERRRVMNTASGTNGANGTCGFGTDTSSRWINVIPGTANSTSGTPSSTVATGRGYSIAAKDLDAVECATLDGKSLRGCKIINSPWSGYGKAILFGSATSGTVDLVGLDLGVTAAPAGAFCAEIKFRAVAQVASGTGNCTLAGRWGSAASAQAWQIYVNESDRKIIGQVMDSTGAVKTLTSTTVTATGNNYDVALTYDGTTLRLFVNGSVQASTAMAGVQTADAVTHAYVGAASQLSSAAKAVSCALDEFRFSNVARYTANYTPATTPFTSDGNTVVLEQFNGTYVVSKKRIIPQGTWEFQGSLTVGSVDLGGATAGRVRVYIRVMDLEGNVVSNYGPYDSPNLSYLVAGNLNWSISAAAAAVVLNPGEWLFFEYWVLGKGVAITGQTITWNVGTPSLGQMNQVTMPGLGLRTLFLQDMSDAVSGTDAVARQMTQFRSCPDTVTGTDAVARSVITSRATSDAVAGTDEVARRTTQFRATADAVAGADSAARTVLRVRATADAVAGTDAATRQTVQARSTSDAVAGTDAVTRRVTFPRATTDVVTGADTPTRTVFFRRAVADAVTGSDAAARQTVQARAVTDAVTGTDATARRTTQYRATTDAVTGSEVASRALVLHRAVTDAVAGTDVATRAIVVARAVTDAVTGSDAASRQIIYGRYTYDGRGDYPVRFPGRHISGFVYNHETGAPLTETTAIVSLVREFGGPADPSQDMTVQTTMSSVVDGSFSFPRDFFDDTPYHFTVDFTLGGTPYHGISDRGLIPELD